MVAFRLYRDAFSVIPRSFIHSRHKCLQSVCYPDYCLNIIAKLPYYREVPIYHEPLIAIVSHPNVTIPLPFDFGGVTLQTTEDLQGDALLHYDAEIEVMNLILLSISNDIYNSVDACTSAKDMWKRVEREALVSVYNRFAQLMNDLERNNMHFPIFTINTKFLNSLQTEWLKYVTQVCLAKRLTVDTFDDLFDYLQNQTIIQGDRVNFQSKNSGNTGRNTRRAYVQEEVVKGSNAQNETRNVQRTLRTSSSGNTSTVQCYNYSGKGHYARNYPKPRVRDSKYFMEQMLLAKQDEAGVLLT
ncbi:hypothetical protein Tco_1062141, partial [Tanacetum coccineum]